MNYHFKLYTKFRLDQDLSPRMSRQSHTDVGLRCPFYIYGENLHGKVTPSGNNRVNLGLITARVDRCHYH